MTARRPNRITLELPPAMRAELAQLASERQSTVSAEIREAIHERLTEWRCFKAQAFRDAPDRGL